MATPDLTLAGANTSRRQPSASRIRQVGLVYAALWTATLLAALAAVAAPSLAGGTTPHPALHGTFGELLSILAANVRVLAVPFILTAFAFARTRFSRALGDAAVIGILAVNAIRIGLELGRWQTRLVPYLPQLPVEYLATAIAAEVWIRARTRARHEQLRGGGRSALLALGLLVLSALIEVYLTPRAR
jgi:hypothetical protein